MKNKKLKEKTEQKIIEQFKIVSEEFENYFISFPFDNMFIKNRVLEFALECFLKGREYQLDKSSKILSKYFDDIDLTS